jgi:hypothetical protein
MSTKKTLMFRMISGGEHIKRIAKKELPLFKGGVAIYVRL